MDLGLNIPSVNAARSNANTFIEDVLHLQNCFNHLFSFISFDLTRHILFRVSCVFFLFCIRVFMFFIYTETASDMCLVVNTVSVGLKRVSSTNILH